MIFVPKINYSSPSPVQYQVQMAPHHAGNPGAAGPGAPGTPQIISSPQDAANGQGDMSFMMKSQQQPGIQFHDPNMGHMVPMNSEMAPHLNGNENSPMQNMQGQRHHEDHSNVANANPTMNDLNYPFTGEIF